jgi:ribosomal protein S18 acetylase RimI-like enzyme
VGEALTRQVIHHAAKRGATELFLALFEDNARAISLYEKLGFVRTTVPALEPLFREEEQRLKRRRFIMRKALEENSRQESSTS